MERSASGAGNRAPSEFGCSPALASGDDSLNLRVGLNIFEEPAGGECFVLLALLFHQVFVATLYWGTLMRKRLSPQI